MSMACSPFQIAGNRPRDWLPRVAIVMVGLFVRSDGGPAGFRPGSVGGQR